MPPSTKNPFESQLLDVKTGFVVVCYPFSGRIQAKITLSETPHRPGKLQDVNPSNRANTLALYFVLTNPRTRLKAGQS